MHFNWIEVNQRLHLFLPTADTDTSTLCNERKEYRSDTSVFKHIYIRWREMTRVFKD